MFQALYRSHKKVSLKFDKKLKNKGIWNIHFNTYVQYIWNHVGIVNFNFDFGSSSSNWNLLTKLELNRESTPQFTKKINLMGNQIAFPPLLPYVPSLHLKKLELHCHRWHLATSSPTSPWWMNFIYEHFSSIIFFHPSSSI